MAALLTAVTYAGLVLLLGGALGRRWLTPGRPGRWTGAVGVALLALGWAGQLAVTLGALGMSAPADVLAYVTGTTTGRAMLTGLLGGVLLLAAEVAVWPVILSVGAAGLTLWGLAGVGHGAGHGVWMHVLHALHAGAMSVWVGGVLALATARPLTADHARRFTPAALGSVGVLAVSGLLMGTDHLENLRVWLGSGYGRTLLVKLLVVALALLASLLVRRAFDRRRGVRPALAREVVILAAVLGVTAVLSNTAPPGGHHPLGGSPAGTTDMSGMDDMGETADPP